MLRFVKHIRFYPGFRLLTDSIIASFKKTLSRKLNLTPEGDSENSCSLHAIGAGHLDGRSEFSIKSKNGMPEAQIELASLNGNPAIISRRLAA